MFWRYHFHGNLCWKVLLCHINWRNVFYENYIFLIFFLIQINDSIHIKYSVQFDQVFANYLNICTYTDIEKKLNWPHLVFCPNTPNIKHGSFYKKENETFFSTLLIDLFCNSKKDERHESSLILVHSALCVFAQI